MSADPWPLRHLVLGTPRLELRPDDDDGLVQLVDAARRGVHPPEEMPFAVPWTDAPPEQIGRACLQHFWAQRAALRPSDWCVNFLVRYDGEVIGTQALIARDFPVTRTVSSGSWLEMAHQGRGLGTEMRAAVLQFAFGHLGADAARSGSYTDNPASRAVSRRLGYVEDGTVLRPRRGTRATEIRLLVTPETLVRPDWTVTVDGLEECRPLLGAVSPQ